VDRLLHIRPDARQQLKVASDQTKAGYDRLVNCLDVPPYPDQTKVT
jgi:hypothetical protein